MSHPFGAGNARFRLGKSSGACESVYLGCFRRDVFDRVGCFDESAGVITEDGDINQRIRAQGGLVYFNSEIEIGYYPRERLIDLARLYFRYGGARAGYLFKHRRLSSIRQVLPPLFLVCLVALAVLSFVHPFFAYLLAAVAAIYIGADLFSAARLAWNRHEPTLFFPLALAFPLMHFPWAIGFFRRLLQGPNAREWGF
jgi:GT2 family glycosyltransferase